jgi:hypothetical protein
MKLKYIYILSILLISIPSIAQTFTKKELQAVNQQTDSLLNLYMKYANFTVDGYSLSELYISDFKNLFTSTNVIILNDIDETHQTPSEVTVEAYVSNVKKWYAGGLETDLENITKGTPLRKNNNIELEVDAKKHILGYYMDKARYDTTINLKFFLSFDNFVNKASIFRISKPEIAKDSLEYKLLNREAENFFYKKDYVNAKKRFEQSLLIFSNATYPAIQITKCEQEIEKQKYDKRKPLYLLLSLQPNFTTLSINSKESNNSPSASSGFGIAGGIGVEMDLVKNRNRKFFGGVGIGLKYSTFETTITLSSLADKVKNQLDIDKDTFDLLVSVKGLKEKLKLTYFEIPMYIQMKYLITESLSLRFRVGVKLDLSISKKYESSGYAEYIGQYGKDYNYIILYGNELSAYGFGSEMTKYNGTNSSLQEFYLSGLAALGVGYKINNTFNLFGNFQYNLGLTDIFKATAADYHISYKKGSLNSMSGFLSGKASSLGIELGITMRIF